MLGVRFVAMGDFSEVLWKTIAILGTEDYDWFIDCLMAYGKEYSNLQLEENIYTWESIQAVFGDLGSGFVMFGRIRRYAHGESVLPMETLEDYETSQCSLILLCIDVREYEIYAKDEREVTSLYDACIAAGFDEVELQTDDNCGRTGMSI